MGWIVVLSVAGFGGFLVVDLGPVQRNRLARLGILTVAVAALVVALLLALTGRARARVPALWRGMGGGLALLGAAFTVYTVFIEIPLIWRRTGRAQGTLVREGTYAVCRHPGFWGILMFVCGLSLLVPAPRVWGLAALWVGLELIVVAVQDVWIFPARFPDYETYRQQTPFLIPRLPGLRAAWAWYRHHATNTPSTREETHAEVPGENQ